MIDVERTLQTVEEGLLTATRIKGRSQEALSLRERMAYYHVPGFSITLIDQDEITWTAGYGLMAAGGAAAVTEETIFQVASISKPVTAMTALHLVEAGLLDLDANVNEGLRSWQIPENEHTRENKVTLRGLLSHSAGVNVSGYPGYPAGEPLPTLLQVFNGESPAVSEPVQVTQTPGEEFRYSGGGYLVIQQLMEDVTGRPLAELARELIFDKLGMKNSTYESRLLEVYLSQAATAHRANGDPVPRKWHTYPEQAAASLWSTPSELGRVVIEVLKSYKGESELVLSPQMTRQMLTPQVRWMGLGYVIVEMDGWQRFDHPGWNEGFHSYLAGYLGAGQGIVWMTNGENGRLLGWEVMRGLAMVFGWPELQVAEKSIAQVNPTVFTQYTGEYRFPDYPDFGAQIIQAGDDLFLQELNGGIRFQLYPETETDFFCLPRAERFRFIKNEDGKIHAMMFGEQTQLERI